MMRSLIAAWAALAAVTLAPPAQADSDSHGYFQYLVSRGMIGDRPGQYSGDTMVGRRQLRMRRLPAGHQRPIRP
jgi:hypothetical protein